jgi:hypothetical protein
MTPDEAAEIARRLDQHALEATAMLARIAGYINVLKWAVCFGALMALVIVLELAK